MYAAAPDNLTAILGIEVVVFYWVLGRSKKNKPIIITTWAVVFQSLSDWDKVPVKQETMGLRFRWFSYMNESLEVLEIVSIFDELEIPIRAINAQTMCFVMLIT